MPAAAAVAKSTSLSPTITARSARPPAMLDGARQMAGSRLAHGERVAAGDGAEARCEAQRLQQRLGQAFELVGAHRQPRAGREQTVEQLGDALERPAADGDIVGVEGEELLVQALELASRPALTP